MFANSASIERGPRGPRIDRTDVPDALLTNRRVVVRFHPCGHLALVHVRGDRKRNGRLELAPLPGRGQFSFLAHAGGSGFFIDEAYRDGAVHTTFCSPWHDGEESRERAEFRTWVIGALASLASITS